MKIEKTGDVTEFAENIASGTNEGDAVTGAEMITNDFVHSLAGNILCIY